MKVVITKYSMVFCKCYDTASFVDGSDLFINFLLDTD